MVAVAEFAGHSKSKPGINFMEDIMDNIPERHEPAEISAAKDIAQAALESSLTAQGVDPYDESNPIDLIALADAAVEALIEAGATIPEVATSPFVATFS